MDSCCQTPTNPKTIYTCPSCLRNGKAVPSITLKAMLKPSALENFRPEISYAFCSTPSCDVVYFYDLQIFNKDTLKVPVFQKDNSTEVPVCYCFNWTRERIKSVQDKKQPIDHIREQVQADRCGCEVNNPQGACCLGNVTVFVRSLETLQ
ncbi:putative iron-sulfur cluster-binding metallochaperone [Paenibacillus planticolens]|uniref:(2Fe-2S)-binding protein n=1 Tax=Paenibacillus planticolens TaxID=2654976 RepID=A0ABX1ZIY4_9BACL|nr:copper chaperone Copz family protein [Paenibacillus planticolens]NOV00040.1 (2Fe-2S)-binding protein [Paenibacillus planticolens]